MRKTSHQLAKELLEMPDLPVVVLYWSGENPTPEKIDWNCEDEICLVPKKK